MGLAPNVRGDRRRVLQHFVEGLCPPQPLRPSLLSTDEHAPESQNLKARRRSGVQVLWFGLVTAAAEASKTQRQQQELAILRATLGLIILV